MSWHEYRRGRHGFREYSNPPALREADVVKVRAMLTQRFPDPVEREHMARMIGVA